MVWVKHSLTSLSVSVRGSAMGGMVHLDAPGAAFDPAQAPCLLHISIGDNIYNSVTHISRVTISIAVGKQDECCMFAREL